jgi:hypothetical protein
MLTLKLVANAIKAGVAANFQPSDQAAELEKISGLFLDMAASVEMVNIDAKSGLPADPRHSHYAAVLGDLGWLLDVAVEEENRVES